MGITKVYRFRKVKAKKNKPIKPAMMMNRFALSYFLLGIVMLLLFICGIKHVIVATLIFGFLLASVQVYILGVILRSTHKYSECGCK
ncbi:hypothetical protein ACQYAD_08120 [Neobacillus sp. SM06]|uniref:hypothetical protein n=1 Tax=Neobacillus sp. SM06 TaxID=3422492 RepID=UPI003D29D1EA